MRLHSLTWVTLWFKRLVVYAKYNRDLYKNGVDGFYFVLLYLKTSKVLISLWKQKRSQKEAKRVKNMLLSESARMDVLACVLPLS